VPHLLFFHFLDNSPQLLHIAAVGGEAPNGLTHYVNSRLERRFEAAMAKKLKLPFDPKAFLSSAGLRSNSIQLSEE